jgi:hypothetical protein
MPPPAAPPRPESAPRPPPHAPRRARILSEHNNNGINRNNINNRTGRWTRRRLKNALNFVLWHCTTLAIYAIPVLIETRTSSPTLDELHIVSEDNRDINGADVSWSDIWQNDYWGRPLNSPSSHKSWRPLSVFLFRHLKGPRSLSHENVLRMHRLVSIITHAATAELVGILAVQWYQPPLSLQSTLSVLAKLAFCLHPTHVEVTANAANRPHLLAILCGLLASSPTTNFGIYVMAIVSGFLSCETFLFQTVGIVTTMVLLSYRRRVVSLRRILRVIPPLLPRIITLAFVTISYLYYRYASNSLSIPDGLIRPAENPFFTLTGHIRFKSYLYTTVLHIYKQLDLDVIGFSHEYGHACITPVESFWDRRLHKVWWLLLALYLLLRKIYKTRLFYLYLAWTASLFPITGIIKVGTFVSDRLVVASTVPIAIAQSIWLFQWLTMSSKNNGRRRCILAVWFAFMYSRVYFRSLEWMDSVPLLESSLRTCPRFAKGHLEMSKIYSSLYPEKYDLQKARRHLEKAKTIDPNFCDVHQQFAIVSAKEGKWIELEKELFLSLQCPYTMGGAVPIWQDYWTQQLDVDRVAPPLLQRNQQRYRDYNEKLRRLGEEQEQAMTNQARHPFAWIATRTRYNICIQQFLAVVFRTPGTDALQPLTISDSPHPVCFRRAPPSRRSNCNRKRS